MRWLAPMALVFYLIGCQSTDFEPGTGALRVQVQPYNQFGEITSIRSGVRVTISDSLGSISGTTDELGVFETSRLAAGVYSLRLEKDGFGPQTFDNIRVLEAGYSTNVGIFNIWQISNTEITNLEAQVDFIDTVNYQLILNGNLAPADGQERSVRLFFSVQGLPQPGDYGFTLSRLAREAWSLSGTYADTLDPSQLQSMEGFEPGANLWVSAYGDVPEAYTFTDTANNLEVFPSLSPDGAQTGPLIVP